MEQKNKHYSLEVNLDKSVTIKFRYTNPNYIYVYIYSNYGTKILILKNKKES